MPIVVHPGRIGEIREEGLRVAELALAMAGVLAGMVVSVAVAQDPATQGPVPAAPPPTAPKPKPLVLAKSVEAILAEQLARQIIAASPLADPSDTAARDAAAEKLGRCTDLFKAARGRILWGGFHPEQGYDPANYRLIETSRDDLFQLTQFDPEVWAKLYLSTFMFPGEFEVRSEGRFTVLDLKARFRSSLGDGEYPYPFWHSPNKWTAYVNVESILLVFEPGRLVAAMRKSPDPLSLNLVKKPWDGKWVWRDAQGMEQPRVTLFKYQFSADNPHVPALEQSYRDLANQFRAQECMMCHEPDNRGRINDLLLLNYPNQSLIARRTLVAVLQDNQMPPGNSLAGEETGIHDEAARKLLIDLAKAFEATADEAFAFERARGKAAP
jgi:hypothetical protein